MAEEFKPTCVKDVPADVFITAYSAHLKANDKVGSPTVAGACTQAGGLQRSSGLVRAAPSPVCRRSCWYQKTRATGLCIQLREGAGLGLQRAVMVYCGVNLAALIPPLPRSCTCPPGWTWSRLASTRSCRLWTRTGTSRAQVRRRARRVQRAWSCSMQLEPHRHIYRVVVARVARPVLRGSRELQATISFSLHVASMCSKRANRAGMDWG
jgi:hypothetical protein